MDYQHLAREKGVRRGELHSPVVLEGGGGRLAPWGHGPGNRGGSTADGPASSAAKTDARKGCKSFQSNIQMALEAQSGS